MSKRIAISMRRVVSDYGEARDALASSWFHFASAVLPNTLLVPVPNLMSSNKLQGMTDTLSLDGLILTGGDDWGLCQQRDFAEKWLFSWAMKKSFPVLGVCRGAQVINILCGGSLVPVAGHKAIRHSIELEGNTEMNVNSYHSLGIMEATLAPSLEPLARAFDGSVEAFVMPRHPVTGIMWHPERENVTSEHDCSIITSLFGE